MPWELLSAFLVVFLVISVFWGIGWRSRAQGTSSRIVDRLHGVEDQALVLNQFFWLKKMLEQGGLLLRLTLTEFVPNGSFNLRMQMNQGGAVLTIKGRYSVDSHAMATLYALQIFLNFLPNASLSPFEDKLRERIAERAGKATSRFQGNGGMGFDLRSLKTANLQKDALQIIQAINFYLEASGQAAAQTQELLLPASEAQERQQQANRHQAHLEEKIEEFLDSHWPKPPVAAAS